MATILGTTENNGAAGTLVLTPEVGTASGDVLVVFLNDDAATRTLTAPDGTWTTIPGDNVVNSVIGFYKVLSAAPDANYTFSGFAGGGSNVNAGTMTTIALAGDTVEAVTMSEADENVSGTVLATAALTGVDNPSVLLCSWGADDGVTVSSAPSGMTLESAVEPGATLALETYSQVNPGTGSLAKSLTWSGNTQSVALAVLFDLAVGGASAAITGTLATGTKTQADVVEGGQTIILTLTGDTFVASGATFDAQRQAIINGLDAASSPATGWNTLVRDTLDVSAVVRTSDTIVTITLPAIAGYAITADEVITCTIPAAALTGAVAIESSPTITIHEGAVLSAYSGTTNASGVKTTDLTSDIAGTRVLTTALVNGTVVARTTTLPS